MFFFQGYVIGGLSTFFCSITLLLTLLGTVLIAAVGCDGLREMVKENGGDISEFDETCALGKACKWNF